jgi:hypothetical protein
MVHQEIVHAFRTSSIISVLVLAAFLMIFVPPLMVLSSVLVAAIAWAIFSHPSTALGILLAVMPVHFLTIAIGKFYGLEHMSALSICTKEIPLLLLAVLLWRRNGFTPVLADWFVGAFFIVALVRSFFGGFFMGFADDFVFLIPYAVGRVTILTETQERLWAQCGLWIAAILSIVGIGELLILGEEPRKLLLSVAFAEDDLSGLRAGGYEGLRASSTMAGPLAFGALCMLVLIIWWVYFRKPLPALIVVAGLICSLSRSAWIGTIVAVSILAFRASQKKRLLKCGLVGIGLFFSAVALLQMDEFVSMSAAGQDNSTQVHIASLRKGLEYVAVHPLGTGGGSIGFRATKDNALLENLESVYLTYGANYGWLALLSFVGFVLSALLKLWKAATPSGNAALGILIGFAIMMMFEPMHTGTPLNSWVWVPIGLSLRSMQENNAAAK